MWSADHLELGRRVAVKFLSPEVVRKDPSLRERFEREAGISERLASDHAVEMLEHGETDDGTPYIVMELLDGIDLARAVITTGMLTLREVSSIVSQVARVLDRAHALGIVHRDIKPDNIFLVGSDHEPFVKVLDFGIAKQTGRSQPASLTKIGAIIGTPEFMSPEQTFSSKDVDHRADLFSLGMVAYFALAGELPYEVGEPGAHWLLRQQRPDPITGKREDLPPEIDAWFERALATYPDKRFQSAAEMAESFAVIAASEPESPIAKASGPGASGPGLDEGPDSEDVATGNFDHAPDSEPVTNQRAGLSEAPPSSEPLTTAREAPSLLSPPQAPLVERAPPAEEGGLSRVVVLAAVFVALLVALLVVLSKC